jgi:hypothetical protein
MLGLYENFPQGVHGKEIFTYKLSRKRLQQKLLNALLGINGKTFSFKQLANPATLDCTVILEIGIADAESFNYLDVEETQKALEILKKEPFENLDFFLVFRYYRSTDKCSRPLKFDYYMLRMNFNKDGAELRVFHEKGPRYVAPEDIITFLVNIFNAASTKRILKPVV